MIPVYTFTVLLFFSYSVLFIGYFSTESYYIVDLFVLY